MTCRKLDGSTLKSSDDDYETRLWNALSRLISGQSENESLSKDLKDGRPYVNIVNVAKEAGCSRTLIGYDGCTYQEVRNAILAVSQSRIVRIRGEKTVEALINTVKGLEVMQNSRDEVYAQLVDRTKAISRKLISNVTPFTTSAELESVLELLERNLPIKRQIAWLRKKVSELKLEVCKRDTRYANLILRARAYETGNTLDGVPLKRATKAEKRRALSIVGNAL